MRRLAITLLGASISLSLAGCDDARTESAPSGNDGPVVMASSAIPDACNFLTGAELSTILGLSVEDGEPEAQPSEASQCRFRTQRSVVAVNIFPTSAADFDERRAFLGADAESVAGVGDSAYFWGPTMIHVRVADRAFSVRVGDELGDRLRPAMLELARVGAEKLGS